MRCMRVLWLLVPVVACKDRPSPTDSDSGYIPDCPTWYIDYDGDGYGSDNMILIQCDQPDGFIADNSDCNDLDAGLNPATVWYADADADTYGDPNTTQVACSQPEGYVLDSEDCDDTDPTRTPETLWARDQDNDGYGYPGNYISDCEQPEGYSDNASDCDDSRDDIHPDADELCDERDNDCDNIIDEDAIDAELWYLDLDEDGYGDAGSGVRSCEAMLKRVTDGTDCDDSEPAINPGQPEICNDALDNNCDAIFDECWGDLDASHAVIVGDEESSQFGRSLSPAGDVNGDGYEDLWVGAYLDDDGGADAGAAYLFYGPFSGSVDQGTTADVVLAGGTSSSVGGDNLGYSVSGGVDANNDGTPDVLVGSHRNSDQKSGMGCASLILGQPSGTLNLPDDGDSTFWGESAWARMGHGVLLSEDMTGDGRADVVLGAPFYPVTYETGAFYVFKGPFLASEYDGADASLIVYGDNDFDRLGYFPRSVDFNGDGNQDLVFGAFQVDVGGSSSGGVYIFTPDSQSGVLGLTDAEYIWIGEAAEDQAGFRVRGLGDVDGDGLEDLGATAPGSDTAGVNAGAAYVLLGGTASGTDLSAAAMVFTGAVSDDGAGSDIDAGDIDGDGALDLVVGALYAGDSAEGEVYVFYAPTAGTYSLADADVTIQGEGPSDNVGGQIELVKDLLGTGDGADDLVVGTGTNDRGGNDAGGVFLFGEFVE